MMKGKMFVATYGLGKMRPRNRASGCCYNEFLTVALKFGEGEMFYLSIFAQGEVTGDTVQPRAELGVLKIVKDRNFLGGLTQGLCI